MAWVLVAASLMTGATAAIERQASPIEEGDHVVAHANVYRQEDGALVWTSDPDVAARAIAEGNPYLHPNLTHLTYQPIQGYVILTNSTAELSRFVLGHRAGDVVRTPFVVDALGTAAKYEVPAAIGPLDTIFTIDLSKVYTTNGTAAAERTFGLRDQVHVGQRIPYAEFLEATLVSLDGDNATLRIDFPDGSGARIFSKVLGLNLTTEILPDGRVVLHPDVTPGERFQTRGCKLPMELLPPGIYRIESISPEVVTVREAPPFREFLLDEDLQFEYRIVKVDKWGALGRAADVAESWLANVQIS